MSAPTALVVEDELLIAMEIAQLIEEGGWRVLGPAATVSESLALLASVKPDLAFVDVRLRNGTSAEIVARLRELDVPTILATAHPDPEMVAGPVVAGLPKLAKPIDPDTIRSIIDRDRGITYTIDHERRIVFLFGRGALTVADALDLQNRLRADPAFDAGYDMLADYRAAISVRVEMQRLGEVAANAPFAPQSRRAFVVHGAVNYEAMCRFQSHNGAAVRNGEVGIFHDFETAKRWLRRE